MGTKRLPESQGFTIRTVQAPHSPSAQPSLEPVSPFERTKSSSVVDGGRPWATTGWPFNRKRIWCCPASSSGILASRMLDRAHSAVASAKTLLKEMLALDDGGLQRWRVASVARPDIAL